jgi:hypothetical protein
MYGWFNIGSNVSGIMFNMVIIVFLVTVAIAVGFLVYAAKKLKKAEETIASLKGE